MRKIVYTRHSDGGVSVYTPKRKCLTAMALGGYWADEPPGYGELQVEWQIAGGIDPDAARRFVRALTFGGLTEAEGYAMLRDRDCAHLGYHLDLIDHADLPDRWFRGAWRRSHNGGPVGVDLKLARPLQWKYAREAVAAENKRRLDAFDTERPIEPNWEQIRTAIKHARDEEELRRVWPL